MAKVQNYPKSSCQCYNCEKRDHPPPSGYPTNISVESCTVPDYFECFNHRVFKRKNTPNDIPGFSFLNQAGTMNPCFFKVDGECHGCPKETYVSHDPRLLDVPRNILTSLDRPPFQSKTLLKDVYNDDLTCYGQSYRNYEDINAGDIRYYIDHSTSGAFHEPTFDIPSETTGVLFKDPMGSLKPLYFKQPLTHTDNGRNNYSCLTWINDSTNHREDIMSSQQRKFNQTRYEPRWTN